MKYYARVTLDKEFEVEWPENFFTDQNLKYIWDYASYFRGMDWQEIRHEMIDAYAEHGDGYFEQFACSIGWCNFRHGFPWVKVTNLDVDVDDSYLEVHE